MRDDLVGLLERADLALGSAAGVISEETLAPLIESVCSVRTRLAYPEEVLVAALAGGTGSGKSSLFNALTGDYLVEVGGIRPTTSRPAAAVPARVGSAMDGYLDALGVDDRHTHDGPPLCVLDLPDTDSVEASHRHRVDRLLPLVDVVVWVSDPEKYRDARLHHEYIEPMADYAGQLLFVMNQADRLEDAALDRVVSDLRRALVEDGIEHPKVVTTAAAPPSGPPIGVEGLLEALEAMRSGQGLYHKLLIDVEEAGNALQAGAGTALGFDARARDAVEAAVRSLEDGDEPGASRALTTLLDELVAETGGDTAAKLERVAADVPGRIRRIHEDLQAPADEDSRSRWFRRRPSGGEVVDVDEARSLVAEAVIRPARAVVAKRALAVASVAELVLEVERLRETRRR